MLKRISLLLCLCIGVVTATLAQGEVVGYYKIDSFTIAESDTLLMNFGSPPGIIVPAFDVDVYKVLYKTPYRHPDSLVTVSAALAVPKNLPCGVPLAEYFHGTTSKRTEVPSYGSAEMKLGVIFASTGYIVAMPDYIGLGDCDTSVPIHPYEHTISQGNTGVSTLRASRSMLDSLGVETNGQLFLFGYSQGGSSTVATLKNIEENYSSEFQVTASAPMSGAYDLKGAQADLIASDSTYPTPGYLPFLILGYQGVYGNLYDSIEQIMKYPYDSLMPALFYPKQKNIGYINGLCTPVPKHMIVDSVITRFQSDSTYILRQLLADNDLLGWAPQSPVKLLYCHGDDQVTYLNSENAYADWTSRGAPNVTKTDFGNYDHGGCVQFALLAAFNYFQSYKQGCNTGIEEPGKLAVSIYPNPASGVVFVQTYQAGTQISLYNVLGQKLLSKISDDSITQLDISDLLPGTYFVEVIQNSQRSTQKLMLR